MLLRWANPSGYFFFFATYQNKQGVCHTLALPFTLKVKLRQKTNYENSNISPCKNIIFKKKSSKRNKNPSTYYNKSQVSTQAKVSCFKKNPHIKKIDLLFVT
jgi:hypothetical protein